MLIATKLFKIIYYIFIAFIVVVALLFIVSAFPITENYKLMVVQVDSVEPKINTGNVVMVKSASDSYDRIKKIKDFEIIKSWGVKKILEGLC